jgi:hypothetical protein
LVAGRDLGQALRLPAYRAEGNARRVQDGEQIIVRQRQAVKKEGVDGTGKSEETGHGSRSVGANAVRLDLGYHLLDGSLRHRSGVNPAPPVVRQQDEIGARIARPPRHQARRFGGTAQPVFGGGSAHAGLVRRQLKRTQHLLDLRHQVGQIEGLGQRGVDAERLCTQRRRIGGERQEQHPRLQAAQPADEISLAQVRQVEVDDGQSILVGASGGECLAGCGCQGDAARIVLLQRLPDQRRQLGIGVDDQHRESHEVDSSTVRRTGARTGGARRASRRLKQDG